MIERNLDKVKCGRNTCQILVATKPILYKAEKQWEQECTFYISTIETGIN